MINWGQNSALAGFQNALALGADIGGAIKQRREDGALSAYMEAARGAQPGGLMQERPRPAADPGGTGDAMQEAYDRLNKINPRLAFQVQGQMASQQAAQAKIAQEQNQRGFEGLQTVGKLLEGVADEPTFQRARTLAQQNGIDVSRVPTNYDPEWVNGQREFIQKMQDPKEREALSTAGKLAADEGLQPGTPEFGKRVNEIWRSGERKIVATQAGGGVAEIDPITGAKMVIMPNAGGYTPGASVAPQAGPAPGAVVNGHRFKGGNPNDRNSWEVVGGSGGNVGGGFPASGIGG